MDIATVQSAWMEPATSVKKKAKTSMFLGRRLLGEKGVGRFAAARLAEELELITRTPHSPKEVYALFDWAQFDNDELYLDEVLVLAEEREPSDLKTGRALPGAIGEARGPLMRDGSHGTILRMNRLKKDWASYEIEDLRRGLSRLVSPFDQDRGFRIFLQLPNESVGTAQEVEPPVVIKYPHYEVAGSVQADGAFDIAIKVQASDRVERVTGWFRRVGPKYSEIRMLRSLDESPDSQTITCGSFTFRVLVWDRDKLESVDDVLGVGIRSIRKDLDSIAGISIYRDGFRVLPYGEPENDWLRLDMRRVQNPTLRLSNNQLTGYITISADSNPNLRDQSNREGLNDNQAYAELRTIVLLALAELEASRFSERREGKSKKESVVSGLLNTPDLTALRQQIAELSPSAATLKTFDTAARRWEAQVVEIRRVLSRYHSLATLGSLMDKVVHDSRQPLSTIQAQSTLARENAADALDSESRIGAECKKVIKVLDHRFGRIKEAASIIDLVIQRVEPFGGRKRGRPSKRNVEDIIRDAFAHFDDEIDKLHVKVTLPTTENAVTVDAAELQEVFINLLSNSLYWLKDVAKERRAIKVTCSKIKTSELQIIFADSGPGVPHKIKEAIFEPYFSTKPQGVGLGLVLAGEIVRDYYDGDLELLDSGPLKGATFRITLRKRV
jgi:hypothetical protein